MSEAVAQQEAPTKVAPRLKALYEQEVGPAVARAHNIKNPMAWPRLEKIVLNVNMGRHLDGAKLPAHVKETVLDTLATVSGQKPIVIRAKRSVSNFKVRQGYETAAMVTMRRERMWFFLERLIHLVTPRIRDFRGLSDTAFDQAGNYSMGLTEQAVFPEIDMAKAQFTHGMHITIVLRNSNPQLSREVLAGLGMPFRKREERR